jgi:tetratricopeptide (TPR) repeat protein
MGSVTGTFNRLKGGSRNEDTKPPTDSELRSRLMADAVRQIAGHIVNTDERVEVFLARHKGALDDGDKQAEAGLWERALETFETAPPLGSKEDDAYRLYNIGVAYEALAYQAEDQRAAMKYLEEAAINYGKAIDAKPAEKYFLEPQKRIETAIAHYKQLEGDKTPNPVPEGNKRPRHGGAAAAQPSPWGSGTFTPDVKALTNAQVIAMVKSGMDDDTVAQAIRSAKAVNFDLSDAGQKDLTGNGISSKVLAAMKARAATKPTTNKPAAAK